MKKFFKDCIKAFEVDVQTVMVLALTNFNNRF